MAKVFREFGDLPGCLCAMPSGGGGAEVGLIEEAFGRWAAIVIRTIFRLGPGGDARSGCLVEQRMAEGDGAAVKVFSRIGYSLVLPEAGKAA
ncbi:MAG: hypothetical protein ACP5E5_09285 [Acidobacteriaceae bacterium]